MEVKEYEAMYVAEKTNWWFVGRDELIHIILKSIFDSAIKATNSINILDIGCGTGGRLEGIRNYGNVIGIDISKEALKYVRRKAHTNILCADAQLLPIQAESMGVVLLLDVLEHIEDDYTAIKEAYRVLREDGFLIVTVPAHKFLWSLHDKYLHHKRRYNKEELCYVLEKNNFRFFFNPFLQ